LVSESAAIESPRGSDALESVILSILALTLAVRQGRRATHGATFGASANHLEAPG
jgi:hypothetical protein